MNGKFDGVKKRDLLRCQDIIYECSYIGEKDQEKIIWLRNYYTLPKLEKYSKNSDFFCFKLKRKIIGLCRLNKNEICTIYVDPEYHRRGIGTMLVKKIEDLASIKKIRKLQLYARTSAIGFYKKLGYSLSNKKENKMEKEIR